MAQETSVCTPIRMSIVFLPAPGIEPELPAWVESALISRPCLAVVCGSHPYRESHLTIYKKAKQLLYCVFSVHVFFTFFHHCPLYTMPVFSYITKINMFAQSITR